MNDTDDPTQPGKTIVRINRALMILMLPLFAVYVAIITGSAIQRPSSLNEYTGTFTEPIFLNARFGLPIEPLIDPTPAQLKNARLAPFLDGAEQAVRARVSPDEMKGIHILGPFASRGWPFVSTEAHAEAVVILKRRSDTYPDGIIYIDVNEQGLSPSSSAAFIGNCVFFLMLLVLLVLSIRAIAPK